MKEKEKSAVDKKKNKNEINPSKDPAAAPTMTTEALKGKKSLAKLATTAGASAGGGGALNDVSQDTHSLRSKSMSADDVSPIYTYKRMIVEGIKWYDETTYTKPPLRKPRTPTSVMRASPDIRRLKSKRAAEAAGTVGQGLTLTTVSGGPNTALFDGQKPDVYLLMHEVYGAKRPSNSPDASKLDAAAAADGIVMAFKNSCKRYGWKILIAFVTLLPILLLITLFVWYYFFTPRATSTDDSAATTTTNLNHTTNRTKT